MTGGTYPQADRPAAESGVELSVVVPLYNELGCIDPLVERVRATLEPTGRSWELLVVDDGSDDGSADALDAIAAADPRVRVLHFERNCGQSAALDAGFSFSRGELVAILDADLQTYPEDLPELVRELEDHGATAVVGIRVDRHDTTWKRLSSTIANGVRNWLTREDIADTGCPIKVFRGAAIRAVPMFDGMHRFLPTLIKLGGGEVRQVPVRHSARVAGRSKYGTWDRAFRALRDAFAVRWMQRRYLRWRVRDER